MLRTILTSFIVYFISQSIAVGSFSFFSRKKHYVLYNVLVVFCFYSFLNMFLWQYNINFLITITFFYILSLIMYYVHEFRGTNFNFSDVLSLNTAKEVASGYRYEVKPIFIIIGLVIAIEYFVQIFIYKIEIFENYHGVINNVNSHNIDVYRLYWHEIGQVLTFFISFFILKDKISASDFDYSLMAGENEGYIYNFFSSMPVFHRSITNYDFSNKEIKRLLNEVYLQSKGNIKKEDTKNPQNYNSLISKEGRPSSRHHSRFPHIIVIMNESFGTVHRRIKTEVPVTPYYDSLSGVTKGNLFVNTFGGGTANTEFEFLTGMTIGNYPYPVMPYNSLVRKNKYSIARHFNNLGYKTIAMHPYTATNYHRNKVYKRFGFEELLFINDFKNKEYVRNFVSDKSMYEEVIRRFKLTKLIGKKMFLFGITMQNHSGYKPFSDEQIVSYLKDYKERDSVNAYLSLMKISDTALRYLIDYFDNVNDHVIILFFGDHNASFGTEINKLVYDTNIHYEFGNAFVTPFLIYDNRVREDKYIEGISANFLSLELLKQAGLPLDMLHTLLDDLYEKYSVYNYHKALNRVDNSITNIPNDAFMRLEREYFK